MNFFNKPLSASVLMLGIWAAGGLLFAQEKENKDEEVLETITVTARKQEVDLQKAPISVTAVSGDDLEQAHIVKLDDFNGLAPGLTISKNDGAGRVVAIRGVGWETAQNLSTQPSVLAYIDGVYLANPLAIGMDLGEIERIDILRGPQGTEFGQGTTGGAINIITKKPNPAYTEGLLSLSAGTYGLAAGTVAINKPLNDKFALRASVRKFGHDGFSEIEGGALDGYELDDADSLTGQLQFLWRPTDRVSVRLSGAWHDSDHNGAAQRHIDDPNPDIRRLTQDYPSTFALYNESFAVVVDWETSWGFHVKSLTGIQKLEKEQTLDGDRLTTDLTSVNLTGFFPANFDILLYWDNNSEAFSQEVSLTKKSDRADWVFGAYYLDHENFNDFLEAVGPGTPDLYQDQLDNPGPDTLPPFQPPLEFVETRTLTRKDAAIYGQATFHLNDAFALTLGGRYQSDKATDESSQFWFPPSTREVEDEAFTWKAGIDWTPAEDNLLYVLISTGWKNGGTNSGADSGGLDIQPIYKPEEVTSYEIGSKNRFAGNRAHLNATFFYYDYEQYQFILEDPVPFTGGTGSIPEVEIYGAEVEFSALLSSAWRIDGFLNSQDGEIKSDLYTLDTVDFLNSGFGRFLPTGVEDRASLRVNLNGNTPPKLVDFGARLALTHTHIFDSGSVLTSRLDYIHRGEFQYRVFNNPLVDTVPAYDTLGLYFGYTLATIPLSVNLTVSNLTDEDGINSRFSNPYGLHTTSEEYIPPRQIFVTASYNF